ncbi:unnamed protein product [Orchesella dallaii]|uniref:Lipoma HMGIC fusion partner-like 3 protein n=1 Tax=Orchesella dallaii TaxID=48710 RepID=A0ABP1REE7_9HEXA
MVSFSFVSAIGFLWGIFSICYAIITLVVFIQPQWVGTRSPASSGYFGLWRHCAVASVMTEMTTTSEFICRGRLDDFSSIINPAFRVATIFVGIAALVAVLSVFGLILFICAPARQAYFIIAMMQALAAICTGVGLVVFPAGFDAAEVRLTCGPTADRFYLGTCTIRWAYVLAIIGLLDGSVLAVLGFVLGSRHLKLSDEFSSGSTRKIHSISGMNGYPARGGYFYGTDSGPTPSVTYSYASTKRSMGGLQPIVLLPPDTESEYRSKASLYRAEYATPKQNIQL